MKALALKQWLQTQLEQEKARAARAYRNQRKGNRGGSGGGGNGGGDSSRAGREGTRPRDRSPPEPVPLAKDASSYYPTDQATDSTTNNKTDGAGGHLAAASPSRTSEERPELPNRNPRARQRGNKQSR